MPVSITALQVENVKRVKAVALECAPGLTVIGGKNRQGKTSVLDAIAWTLGGERFRPSEPRHDGAIGDPRTSITLSNGLVVTRSGKNSALKVIDPAGGKAGQKLLDSFIGEFALDLPKFRHASPTEQTKILLGLLGIGDKLNQLERQEKDIYSQREAVGQIAARKKALVAELPEHPDAPAEPVSAGELIQQQQAILAKNGRNQELRLRRDQILADGQRQAEVVASLGAQLAEAEAKLAKLRNDYVAASKTAEALADESTDELAAQLAGVEATNAKVRANQAKAAAVAEADALKTEYGHTARIEAVRAERVALLAAVKLPLAGLSIAAGALVYQGKTWDCMAGADQLRVATAIARALKPECGFVLVDKLEELDADTLREFGAWLEAEGLQVIGTRVSTGDECSIVIEDGQGEAQPAKPADDIPGLGKPAPARPVVAGAF
jgi:hypothetical protein